MLKYFSKIIFGTIFIFIVANPISVFAGENIVDISTVDIKVNIQKDGTTDFFLRIFPNYPCSLDWNTGVRSVYNLVIKANGKQLKKNEFRISKENNFVKISAEDDVIGDAWELSYKSGNLVSISDRENVKWQAINGTHGYINDIDVLVNSTVSFKEKDRISYRLYAFHGVNSSDSSMIDNNTILYEGSGLGTTAGFSIFVSWPKGSLDLPFGKRIILSISDQPIINWIFFALLLPLLSLVLLIILFFRHKTFDLLNSTGELRETPPSDLSPLQIGILVDKKIFPKTLMATILDFCQRGYLVIIKDGGQFVFGKRKVPDEHMQEWEKKLFEEITLDNPVWTKGSEIKRTAINSLYDPKIKAIYEEAYESATEIGYFSKNPHLVRVKYKLYAIGLHFFSVIGLGWVALSMQSPYFLIPLVGALIAAIIIIRFAYLLPVQSQKGLEARREWLKFRNYLKSKDSLQSISSVSGLFYEYLAYSLVLGVEKDWSYRFKNLRIIAPDWFLQKEAGDMEVENTVDEVINEIMNISEKIGQLHGPSVK